MSEDRSDNVPGRVGCSRRVVWVGAWLCGLGLMVSGCFNAQELRALSEAAPDPRQAEADKMWAAIGEVVAQEGWSVELARREELLLSTAWVPTEDGRRKRVRFLVLLAPMGMALNCTVLYERPAGPEGEGWVPDEEAPTRELAGGQEGALVEAVYGRYKTKR